MLRQKHASLPEDNVQALLYLVTHDQSLQTGLGFREQQEWTWWLRWGKNQLVALGFRHTRHKNSLFLLQLSKFSSVEA